MMNTTACSFPGAKRRLHMALAAAALLPLLAGSGLAMAQAPADEPVATPATETLACELEPKAVAALEQMSAHLRTLLTFSLKSDITKDEVFESGQKIQFASTVEMQVRYPDRLHAEVNSDRKQRQYYYDGKSFTIHAPRMNYYASVDAPPTLRETLAAVDARFGIEMPLVDLFLWGTGESPTSNLKSAIHIGMARIDGAECDHYAFRQEGVDWQVWIERGNSPLPRKLVITTLDEPSQPQYTALLKWDLANRFADKAFVFVPPKGAEKIMLLPLPTAQ